MTANKRKVEVFSAGCGVCDETIALVQKLACGVAIPIWPSYRLKSQQVALKQ